MKSPLSESLLGRKCNRSLLCKDKYAIIINVLGLTIFLCTFLPCALFSVEIQLVIMISDKYTMKFLVKSRILFHTIIIYTWYKERKYLNFEKVNMWPRWLEYKKRNNGILSRVHEITQLGR